MSFQVLKLRVFTSCCGSKESLQPSIFFKTIQKKLNHAFDDIHKPNVLQFLYMKELIFRYMAVIHLLLQFSNDFCASNQPVLPIKSHYLR